MMEGRDNLLSVDVDSTFNDSYNNSVQFVSSLATTPNLTAPYLNLQNTMSEK